MPTLFRGSFRPLSNFNNPPSRRHLTTSACSSGKSHCDLRDTPSDELTDEVSLANIPLSFPVLAFLADPDVYFDKHRGVLHWKTTSPRPPSTPVDKIGPIRSEEH